MKFQYNYLTITIFLILLITMCLLIFDSYYVVEGNSNKENAEKSKNISKDFYDDSEKV